MEHKMDEQEIVTSFEEAMENGHIYAVYQPQINHVTGRMVGAEALMRWNHPAFGPQYPSDFIPVLEKHDLLYRADVYMFELVCRFQKARIDEGTDTVPISVNMSRYDIYHHEYADTIEEIRRRYDVPVKYLRLEITESSAIGGMALMIEVIEKLHSFGYIVEMDDFGSGYSSLNILKSLHVDIIKLDLGFLCGETSGRSGIILSSVIQMAKWLGTPLIAEGVETMEQADYMKSMGCYYIQGYLYAKPMAEEEFLQKLLHTDHEATAPALDFQKAVKSGTFWTPHTMDEIIFNNLVGPAVLFTYREGRLEILRVNEKYIQETGMNISVREFILCNPWDNYDPQGRQIYEDALRKAIDTKEEVCCETWRNYHSACCGDDFICIRSFIQVLGNTDSSYLFYARVQNVTKEKRQFQALMESNQKFRHASEQSNMYAWEYIVATKEMHPCFRCMRDLGLPAVLKNYPDSAIEMGIFPPDYADMYRDWHRRIAEGEEHLEAIIPLTVSRILFHVRYTTEFDENGKALKAYGSATMVQPGEKKGNAG